MSCDWLTRWISTKGDLNISGSNFIEPSNHRRLHVNEDMNLFVLILPGCSYDLMSVLVFTFAVNRRASWALEGRSTMNLATEHGT